MGSDRDAEGRQLGSSSSSGCRYAIQLEGLLDAHWSEWLGMTLTHEEGRFTRLEGSLIDQAALHGLLNKLRDLRLTIIRLERLGVEDTAPPAAPKPDDKSCPIRGLSPETQMGREEPQQAITDCDRLR
jgi:hypothetical protein